MAREISRILSGRAIVFISGAGKESIIKRVIYQLDRAVRKNCIIITCSGAEAWGFTTEGQIHADPIYNLLNEKLSPRDQRIWREIMQEVVNRFGLQVYVAATEDEFRKMTENDPLAIMVSDRGTQITFEVMNGHNLSPATAERLNQKIAGADLPLIQRNSLGFFDLRTALLVFANQKLNAAKLQVEGRLAGVFAVDFALKGVDKSLGVKRILDSEHLSNLP